MGFLSSRNGPKCVSHPELEPVGHGPGEGDGVGLGNEGDGIGWGA